MKENVHRLLLMLSEGQTAFTVAKMQTLKPEAIHEAAIHTAKKLKPYWDLLEEKGMRFYFLPPYSLELNCIELLRHKMKYE